MGESLVQMELVFVDSCSVLFVWGFLEGLAL